VNEIEDFEYIVTSSDMEALLLEINLIKKHDPGIEVILVTGDGSTSAGMEGMQLGLFDYLMKPIDIGVIVERINKAAAKNNTA